MLPSSLLGIIFLFLWNSLFSTNFFNNNWKILNDIVFFVHTLCKMKFLVTWLICHKNLESVVLWETRWEKIFELFFLYSNTCSDFFTKNARSTWVISEFTCVVIKVILWMLWCLHNYAAFQGGGVSIAILVDSINEFI